MLEGIRSGTETEQPAAHVPFSHQDERGASSILIQEPGQEFPQVTWARQFQVRRVGNASHTRAPDGPSPGLYSPQTSHR